MDTAYVRDFTHPPKIALFQVQDSSMLGTWNSCWECANFSTTCKKDLLERLEDTERWRVVTGVATGLQRERTRRELKGQSRSPIYIYTWIYPSPRSRLSHFLLIFFVAVCATGLIFCCFTFPLICLFALTWERSGRQLKCRRDLNIRDPVKFGFCAKLTAQQFELTWMLLQAWQWTWYLHRTSWLPPTPDSWQPTAARVTQPHELTTRGQGFLERSSKPSQTERHRLPDTFNGPAWARRRALNLRVGNSGANSGRHNKSLDDYVFSRGSPT